MVHDQDLIILTDNISIPSISKLNAPGFFPSAGMKSVCFQPQDGHKIVNCVCSPKYGISDVCAIIVSPSSEKHIGQGCSTLLSKITPQFEFDSMLLEPYSEGRSNRRL